MLCHYLNRGIEPHKIINLPLADKLFYKACYEIYTEDEYEKYKALTCGEHRDSRKIVDFLGRRSITGINEFWSITPKR